MTRHVVLALMYLIPFSMMGGAWVLSETYNFTAVVIGFLAGVVYAGIRASHP
jgi:hypothetical protein